MRSWRSGGVLQLFSFFLFGAWLLSDPTSAGGVSWPDATIDEALARADSTGRIVMIEVYADHCAPCGDMDAALWDTDAGAAFVEGMIPIRIESTSREGQALTGRYAVTGLPAVLFVRADGTEIDRIVGFTSAGAFIEEAEPLKEGFDPLPMLEEELQAHPDSLSLFMPVLERYLYRLRDDEAEALVQRILELDPDARYHQADRALATIAKYCQIVRLDMEKNLGFWRTLLDRFPGSSFAGAGVHATYRASAALGRTDQWRDWICDLVEKQPGNGRVHYALAMTAHRARLRGPCFANAARSARALGTGGAFLDTVAVELEGTDAPGR